MRTTTGAVPLTHTQRTPSRVAYSETWIIGLWLTEENTVDSMRILSTSTVDDLYVISTHIPAWAYTDYSVVWS